MELWQLGALVGADLPQSAGIDQDLWEREKDTLADRAQTIRQMRELPEEAVDITDRVMRQMGIRPQ